MQKNGAVRSQNNLRDLLFTGNLEARMVETYLTGSYARETAVQPLDDVDIVVLIDPTKWDIPFLASYPKPDDVLGTFARAIRYRYPNSSVHTQRRSIGLKLNHLDIDVVPAINEGHDLIRIPDRTSGKWIQCAPKRHTALATKVNLLRGQRFKPLVKLLKTWNRNLPSTACLKSFTIETLATRIFQQEPLGTLDEGALYFFDFLAQFTEAGAIFEWNSKCGISFDSWSETMVVPDTAGTGSNVAARVDWTRAQKFLGQAGRCTERGARRHRISQGLQSAPVRCRVSSDLLCCAAPKRP
jgi:hypothetical protein